MVAAGRRVKLDAGRWRGDEPGGLLGQHRRGDCRLAGRDEDGADPRATPGLRVLALVEVPGAFLGPLLLGQVGRDVSSVLGSPGTLACW
jgi:hypothetical protein